MSDKSSVATDAIETALMTLKPGSLNFYIVSELYKAPLTLMELQDQIADIVGYHPSEGTLYGTASRLKSSGYLATEKTVITVKKQHIGLRMYSLTEDGKAALQQARDIREKELEYLDGVLAGAAV